MKQQLFYITRTRLVSFKKHGLLRGARSREIASTAFFALYSLIFKKINDAQIPGKTVSPEYS